MSSGPTGPGTAPTGSPPSPSSTPSGQTASGNQTPSQAPAAPTNSNIIPNDPLYTVQYINDPAWPADLHLDPSVSNWSEWSRRLRLLCRRQGLGIWLEGNFVPPDASTDACGHCVWTINDESIQAFILQHVCEEDYKDLCDLPNARAMFSELRECYEKLGSHSQILLVEKAIRTEFTPGTRLSQTWDELDTLMRRIKAMGPLDYDKLQIACAIKGLGKHYENLQSTLQSIMNQPNFTLRDVRRCIIEEDELIRNCQEQGLLPTTTAFTSQTAGKARTRTTCSHCKRVSHFADFCVQTSGKMAGRTLEEAKAAYRASKGRTDNGAVTQTTSANLASTGPPSKSIGNNELIYFNGVPYNFVPAMHTVPSTGAPLHLNIGGATSAIASAHIAEVDSDYDFDFIAHIAMFGAPCASTDWDKDARHVDLNQVPVGPVAFTATRVPIRSLQESPFFLDTGANAYISPERSDFKKPRPISPHPIAGLGGSCIFAVGIGTIDIQIAGGHKLVLENVLFAPASNVRLVSVLDMNETDRRYTSHFTHNAFWLTDASGAIILRGNVHKARRLYYLSIAKAHTMHVCNNPTITDAPPNAGPTDRSATNAFHASCVPDVETWHHCLGHCSVGAVINMARKYTVEGMTINLSSSPPKCDACIRGKQTHKPVSKVREGEKATRPLERVFVDLCGLIRPISSSGQLYSMNVIDDYSSYVWTLPLKSKGDAASNLQKWHRSIENQSGHRLKILVTDNGELVSKSMAEWCDQLGIDHQRTAPYTSAQNGRAERLHRTILDKVRMMMLSCSAPTTLWDEFCATSAYLTNLTPSSSLQGCTPFELWYGRKPSLGHLREIGCHAFALIPTATPKTYTWSRPCTLIGYSPHSKAYRLWDRDSGRIFDSFHVSFIEHLDEIPADLSPGTTIALTPESPPSWDVAAAPPVPEPPNRHLCTPTYPPAVPNPPSSATSYQHPPLNPQNNTITITTQTSNSDDQITTIPHTHTDNDQPNTIPSPSPTILPSTLELPLRRSSRTRFSSACGMTNDGLLPNSRLASAISDSAASSARARATRSSRLSSIPEAHLSTFLDDLPSYDFTHAFLSEFSDFRDTHDLLPLDLPDACSLPLDVFLSDIETGSVLPTCDTTDDPSWKDALASPECEYWIAGAREELRSLEDLQVFVLVPRSSVPSGKRLLKGKLVCKRKQDDMGKVNRYKVRYMAKGFAQQPGIDFTKTTAPTMHLESFRSILHLAATLGWDIQHFDVKTAFLHGILPEEEMAYMEQPPGFETPGKEGWVMRLMKSIYGMRQASRRWNQTFHQAVTGWDFKRVPCEWCVYVRHTASGSVIFAVHVDDIFSIANPPEENTRFREQLKSQWEISDLGPIKFALGIAVERDNNEISLSQTAFIDRIVKQFGQSDAHSVDTLWSLASSCIALINPYRPRPKSSSGLRERHTANLLAASTTLRSQHAPTSHMLLAD